MSVSVCACLFGVYSVAATALAATSTSSSSREYELWCLKLNMKCINFTVSITQYYSIIHYHQLSCSVQKHWSMKWTAPLCKRSLAFGWRRIWGGKRIQYPDHPPRVPKALTDRGMGSEQLYLCNWTIHDWHCLLDNTKTVILIVININERFEFCIQFTNIVYFIIVIIILMNILNFAYNYKHCLFYYCNLIILMNILNFAYKLQTLFISLL